MYKQIKPLRLSGKTQVTPEQSEVVQKALFEMGYAWKGFYKSTQVSHLTYPGHYIFWYSDKIMSWMPNCQKSELHPNPLHLFTDYFEPIK